jgi:hypothetical protein
LTVSQVRDTCAARYAIPEQPLGIDPAQAQM